MSIIGSEYNGPWDCALDVHGSYSIEDSDGTQVCYVRASKERYAKLVAAGPELLDSIDVDTLEAIADELTEYHHSARAASLRAVAKAQRAAIAKATGAQP